MVWPLATPHSPRVTRHSPLAVRFVTIPSFIIGVALAIVFFKLYGVVTRPSVPSGVTFVLTQFAPGVELGGTVADARHSVAAMTYVPHLGYVGLPGSRSPNLPDGYTATFQQVRLLLDEKARAEPRPNPERARIDAVEVETADMFAASSVASAMTLVFRRNPSEGCLRSDKGPNREVLVWKSPNDRGGVAIIDGDHRYAELTITSVLAYRGKFDGGRTLRGNYSDVSCAKLAEGGTSS